MARVARSVLGHPTSSPAIERDFGIAGKFLCGLRNRMDGELLELMLYLSANSALIPTEYSSIRRRGGSRLHTRKM